MRTSNTSCCVVLCKSELRVTVINDSDNFANDDVQHVCYKRVNPLVRYTRVQSEDLAR